MLENIKIENILFLDIETVPIESNWADLSDSMKELWDKKSKYFRESGQTPADVYQRAGIYAEFGKIVCISVGIAVNRNKDLFFRLKSFYGNDEKFLLSEFAEMISLHKKKSEDFTLCAHNGKEFDFPYIARRMLINGVKLPDILNVAGKKPWEVKFIDTLEMWKFGDYKHYTSLNLLTQIFDIPTPKDDIDGSMVADVFWKDDDIERIVTYCEKDVLAVVQLFLKYNCKELIKTENIESVTVK